VHAKHVQIWNPTGQVEDFLLLCKGSRYPGWAIEESRYGYKQTIDSPSISTIMSSGMPPKKVSTNPQVLSNYICKMKYPAKMKHIKHYLF